MVTSSSDVSIAVEALTCGAYGYVIKPFRMDEILIQVDNALRRRDLEIAYRDREATLQQRVRQATGALRKTQEEVVFRLVAAAGYRDNETGAHIRRIGLYSAQLARLLYWNQDLVDTIRLAAPMHDVGKIGIPDRILQKPGKLDPDEWSVMQTHSALGEELLKGSDIPSLMMASRIARSHHERWNGTGYPDQLAGEGIPVEARIVGLVDVYDALTHARCYKPAWPEEKALALIEEEAGQHFDPTLAQLFIDHHREIQSIRLSLEDDLQHSTGRPASP